MNQSPRTYVVYTVYTLLMYCHLQLEKLQCSLHSRFQLHYARNLGRSSWVRDILLRSPEIQFTNSLINCPAHLQNLLQSNPLYAYLSLSQSFPDKQQWRLRRCRLFVYFRLDWHHFDVHRLRGIGLNVSHLYLSNGRLNTSNQSNIGHRPPEANTTGQPCLPQSNIRRF